MGFLNFDNLFYKFRGGRFEKKIHHFSLILLKIRFSTFSCFDDSRGCIISPSTYAGSVYVLKNFFTILWLFSKMTKIGVAIKLPIFDLNCRVLLCALGVILRIMFRWQEFKKLHISRVIVIFWFFLKLHLWGQTNFPAFATTIGQYLAFNTIRTMYISKIYGRADF